ncbi:glycerophosphodiester phosphodiesterase family protein [Oceanomicrobium pacificus]|uniref:glycerophosphodiester phosphodiesterase family protein n=1 Tax=Oceanomicrobium pacificus TaxID=2692916 RepID=UPI001F377831|nr:glycerophosphodiester phosphodiesterase family protein [Oceanomicrobium pacificus]
MTDAPDLPGAFLERPIAHRALHSAAGGVAENSMAAIEAALGAGYGIEVDLQLSADGEAMVFHDDDLKRLTGHKGAVRARTADELAALPLKAGGGTIPRLSDLLDRVNGHVPLLIEIKDQTGQLGPAVGPLEERTCALLKHYDGPVALMSFNPHSVARCAEFAPAIPRGLVTCRFGRRDFLKVPMARLRELQPLPDVDRVGAAFVSHDRRDLSNPALAPLKARGMPLLCWTVRSAAEEAAARQVADNITFEGYRPEPPAA